MAYILWPSDVIPLIAPPTPPQLEQDKQAIDESFEKAFFLLDQLAKDTEVLKSSEQARTERLDTTLTEVESVIAELRTAGTRREQESRRIQDEVRGLKDLIPKAMETQKEATDSRLQELNTELKSLKKLMGQRMNPTSSTTPGAGQYGRAAGSTGTPVNGLSLGEGVTPKPASVSNGHGTETVASLQGRSSSPFSAGLPSGRAAIPAWQLAAANKSSTSVNTSEAGSGSQEAGEGAQA